MSKPIESIQDLPENVDAVIKLAAEWPSNCLSGQIWFDRHGRFKDGEMVTTGKIVSKEGNIFKTANSTYLVELVNG